MFETLEGLLKTELNNSKYDAKKKGLRRKIQSHFFIFKSENYTFIISASFVLR